MGYPTWIYCEMACDRHLKSEPIFPFLENSRRACEILIHADNKHVKDCAQCFNIHFTTYLRTTMYYF